jgi:hypothetical protein
MTKMVDLLRRLVFGKTGELTPTTQHLASVTRRGSIGIFLITLVPYGSVAWFLELIVLGANSADSPLAIAIGGVLLAAFML